MIFATQGDALLFISSCIHFSSTELRSIIVGVIESFHWSNGAQNNSSLIVFTSVDCHGWDWCSGMGKGKTNLVGADRAGLQGRMTVGPCSVCKLSKDSRCEKYQGNILFQCFFCGRSLKLKEQMVILRYF